MIIIDPTCICQEQQETFWTLLRSLPHWELEGFIQLVVDGLIIGIGWPMLRKHLRHHECPEDDKK